MKKRGISIGDVNDWLQGFAEDHSLKSTLSIQKLIDLKGESLIQRLGGELKRVSENLTKNIPQLEWDIIEQRQFDLLDPQTKILLDLAKKVESFHTTVIVEAEAFTIGMRSTDPLTERMLTFGTRLIPRVAPFRLLASWFVAEGNIMGMKLSLQTTFKGRF
jgi:hypothetical protein